MRRLSSVLHDDTLIPRIHVRILLLNGDNIHEAVPYRATIILVYQKEQRHQHQVSWAVIQSLIKVTQ